jgi:hypothetical protein
MTSVNERGVRIETGRARMLGGIDAAGRFAGEDVLVEARIIGCLI